jgi:Eco57I restriction-modification methylase
MNRTKLKNYAPQARRDFIQAVTNRAAYYGLTANKIEPITQNGDVAIIAGLAHPRAVAEKRRALEERIKRHGFAQVMEAVAYTWFNRLVAIRFMELHGYLDHGYRVLSHPEGKGMPEILEHAEHVDLSGLDCNKVIELKLDGTKEAELYRMLVVAQCNALNAAMPFLFEKIDDETELLLPNNLLHSNSLIRKLTGEIDEEDWQQVEIIGWLYQFYISEKKDEVIGKVVKSEDIPAATQLFTPNWIVKYMVQNSLGRMWLQTYTHSGLRAKMDYYIEPAEQTDEVKAQLAAITPASVDPETITILDPACGSGHILVEAYDLLKEIYLERGYRLRDIPKLILAKNLYGLDIDDRAAQLAGFALLMKARADDRRIFDAVTERQQDTANDARLVNVFAIQESVPLDAAEMADALLNVKSSPRAAPIAGGDTLFDDTSAQPALMMTEGQGAARARMTREAASREDLIELIELFRQGKTLGSLISVTDELAAKLATIARAVNENLHSGDLYAREAASTLLPFVQQAEVLSRKYDCVIANPPYMGSSYFTPLLKEFARTNYVEGKDDLYGCFILKNAELCDSDGYIGMITIPNWMFLSSFEKLRSKILDRQMLNSLVHNGRGVFGSDFGSCSFVIRNARLARYRGTFKRLFQKQGSIASNDELKVKFHKTLHFEASSDDFKKVPGSPIAYWMSNKARSVFRASRPVSDITETRKGMATGDNARFVRSWHEVCISRVGFGMNRIDASSSGYRWFPYANGGSYRKWYGNHSEVVDWEKDGHLLQTEQHETGRIRAVNLNLNFIFNPGITWTSINSSYFSVRHLPTGFLFSSAANSLFANPNLLLPIMGLLNSIVTTYLMKTINPTLNANPGDTGKLPYAITENDAGKVSKLCIEALVLSRQDWDAFENSWDFQSFPLLHTDLKAATVEASFNNWQTQCAANIKRMQELETENNRLFIEAYGLQDELTPEVPEDQITLARADREADIKRLLSYAVGCMMGRYSLDQEGLVYAHSGNNDFDASQYEIFPADPYGIIPVMESDWFADDAAYRFVEFISTAWSPEHLEANLSFIAESLTANRNEQPRQTIRRYFAASFFKDHLRTYKKRPIYWLFSSGKQRAFQALVCLHRYNDGTLARMRTEHVIPLQGKIASHIDHLASDIETAASTSHRRKLEKERDSLIKQQEELRTFDEKLRHYADKRVTLELDDGVKLNYAKFGDLLAEVKAVTGSSDD